MNEKQWKDKYLYSDMHGIFSVESSCLLHEWIKWKDATNSPMWPLDLVVWDQAKFEEMRVLDNKWNCAIEFWFSRLK